MYRVYSVGSDDPGTLITYASASLAFACCRKLTSLRHWGAPARSGASRRPARRRFRSPYPQLVAVLGHAGEALVTIAQLGVQRGYLATGIRSAPSMVATLLTLTDWLP